MSKLIYDLEEAVAALPATKEKLDMRMVLEPALLALPDLLDRRSDKSLHITYEQPYLNRITYIISKNNRTARLSNHHFFAADNEQEFVENTTNIINPYYGEPLIQGTNLYHPHPWAAGFKLLDGSYDQKIAYATQLGLDNPPQDYKIVHQDARDPETNSYVFNDPLIWHEVMPRNNKSVDTVMVTYKPVDWGQTGPTPPDDKKLRLLYDHEEQWQRQRCLRHLRAA